MAAFDVEGRDRHTSVLNTTRLTRTLTMQFEEEQHHKKTGISGCVFNYTNSIIGAGIIGLPYALSLSGYWFGIILLIFVAFLIDYGVRNLVECGVKYNKKDYELIVEYLYGKTGYYIVTIFMFLFAYGAMIAYHIVIGDTMTPIIKYINPDTPSPFNQSWFIIIIFRYKYRIILCLYNIYCIYLLFMFNN